MSAELETVIEVNHDALELPADMGVANGVDDGQFRYWFITINNPKDEHFDPNTFWPTLSRHFGKIDGGVYQIERARTTHVQGCFHTDQKYRVLTMKNKMRSKALKGWIRPCSDYDASVKYCSKPETRVAGPFWYGDCKSETQTGKRQGKRTDLDAVAQCINEGGKLLKVAQQHPSAFIKYHTGIAAFMALVNEKPPRTTMTELYIYWGVAGAGKSHRAHEEATAYGSVYTLPTAKEANVVWWRGYEGQDSVIIDDYNGWLAITELFKLVDKYEHKVRTHGDVFVQFVSRRIYITSNVAWQLWYAKEFMKEGSWKQAFERRITKCIEFTAAFNAPTDWPDRAASPLTIKEWMDAHHESHKDSYCDCDNLNQHYFVN